MKMNFNDSDLDAIAKETNTPRNELTILPALGTQLNYVNSSFHDALKKIVLDKGHELVSMKLSDVRFVYTTKTSKDERLPHYEFSNLISSSRGRPIHAKATYIPAARLTWPNFFKRKDLAGLHDELIVALNYEMIHQVKPVIDSKKLYDLMLKIASRRIEQGTAFQVSTMVTREERTGRTVNWKRMQADGMFKMVFYEFKRTPSTKKYTKASDKNQQEWFAYTKDLKVDCCIAKGKVKKEIDDWVCAFSTKSKY